MNLVERYWKVALKYVAIPLICLWFLFLIVDLMVMPIITRHGEEFALPEIVGKTESEAQELLTKNKLVLQVAGREFSANKPEGTVLSQIPEAGMMIKSGRNVKVVISAGVKVAEVPAVKGLSLQEATLAIEKAGFVVGDMYWEKIDSLPENIAIETIPTKGTLLPFGSKVSLAVNQGRQYNTVFMPQLVGMPLDRARTLLEGLHLYIAELTHIKDTLYLPNTVLDQTPKSNAAMMKGDSVRLSISETD